MSTLVDLLENAAGKFGDDQALIMRSGLRDEHWTYRRLWHTCAAIARYLREERGLHAGDRVIVISPNQPRLVATLFGAMLARLIPVPLDPFSTREFAADVARNTEASLSISDKPFAIPGVGHVSLAELPLACEEEPATERPQPRDVAEIIYTSGTTGKPKGVVLTHANIWSNVLAADKLVPHASRWRLLSVLPLSHMLAQTVDLFAQLYRGSTIVYGVAQHPAALMKAMRRHRITAMVVVPQVLAQILRALEQDNQRRGYGQSRALQSRIAQRLPEAARRLLSRRLLRATGGALEVFICGGAHLPTAIAASWEALGIPVVQGYGATECSPIIAGNTYSNRVIGGDGRAVEGVEVRLATDGEVQVRGASVFQGYWRNAEATQRAFTPDGWYRTGDLATADAEGNLRIRGRSKDMVALPNGLNVFLEDVDAALLQEPGVRMGVAVDVVRPNGDIGIVGVVIGECCEDTTRSVNARLAPHQRLSSVVLWEGSDFARTTLGKIKRAEVRAWFEQRHLGQERAPSGSAAIATPASKLASVLSQVSGVDARNIMPTSSLRMELLLSSLSLVELALALEEEFGVVLDDGELAGLETVADLASLLERSMPAGRENDFPAWPVREPALGLRAILQQLLLFPLHALFARPFVVLSREKLRGLQFPALFVANHASHFDTISIIRALPRHVRRRLAVAAAADYFYRYSALGAMASLILNTFPFSREGAVRASLEHCGELVDAGWSVLIYPEGTRSVSGELLPFKSGIGLLAVGLDVPVVPVAVLGGHDILPKGRVMPRRAPVRLAFGMPIRLAAGTTPQVAAGRLREVVAELMHATHSAKESP